MEPGIRDVRCEECGNTSDIAVVAVQTPVAPNVLTDLKDIGYPVWLCPHCGCWSKSKAAEDEESDL